MSKAADTLETVAYPLSRPRIHDLPERLRPREQFEAAGDSVTDAVLLAILLRVGRKGQNALDLAQHLLERYDTLTRISRAPVEDLAGFDGMGRVKALTLKAALLLGQRLQAEQEGPVVYIRVPEDAARLLRGEARAMEQEVFWVLLLDTRNKLVGRPVRVTTGILDASLVHPREVLKHAIRASCASIVLAHNHPSGDPNPSAEDIRITRQLVEAGRIVDIQVLDHVILGRPAPDRGADFISLRDSGLVAFQN